MQLSRPTETDIFTALANNFTMNKNPHSGRYSFTNDQGLHIWPIYNSRVYNFSSRDGSAIPGEFSARAAELIDGRFCNHQTFNTYAEAMQHFNKQ